MATIESEIRQLSNAESVSGAVPLVTVAVDQAELADRLRIKWSPGSDELGTFHSAVVETAAARDRYVLVSYDESDPPEIILLGIPGQVANLDEALRGLRVADSEVVDRVDRPVDPGHVPPVAMSVQHVQAALEQAVAQLQDRLQDEVDELYAQVELSRLASLASIEHVELTPRQREVLQLVVSGLSPGEVAVELHVSLGTVERHLRTLRNTLVHQPYRPSRS